MSGAPSTSSLEVLKDLCVQGAFLRENVNHRHTNIHYKAQVRHMHSHSGTVGAHQHLNAPAKSVSMLLKLSHILRPAQETSHHSLLVLPVVITAHFGNLCPAWHPVP